MPPRKSTKSRRDDDFIDDGPAGAGPQTKRTKTDKGPRESPPRQPDTKKRIDSEGNPYWELGGRHRRVTLSKFRGSMLVNIREHYEKDGQVLPGKKGISLSVEQFNAMMSILPQLHMALSESGTEVVMPAFGNVKRGNANVKENAKAGEEGGGVQMKEEEEAVYVKGEGEEDEKAQSEDEQGVLLENRKKAADSEEERKKEAEME